jgi:hypothetical protein
MNMVKTITQLTTLKKHMAHKTVVGNHLKATKMNSAQLTR